MKEDNVVSLDEKRGEKEVADMNTTIAEFRDWETNKLMRSIYVMLTELKNPRQAIAAGMALVTTGKDLLCLELGEQGARAYIGDLKYDTMDIVEARRQEELRGRTDIPENDGGDKEGSKQWAENNPDSPKVDAVISKEDFEKIVSDSEGGETD